MAWSSTFWRAWMVQGGLCIQSGLRTHKTQLLFWLGLLRLSILPSKILRRRVRCLDIRTDEQTMRIALRKSAPSGVLERPQCSAQVTSFGSEGRTQSTSPLFITNRSWKWAQRDEATGGCNSIDDAARHRIRLEGTYMTRRSTLVNYIIKQTEQKGESIFVKEGKNREGGCAGLE